MKNSLKYFLLVFVLLSSAACSLPFLAVDSIDPESTEDVSTAIPTAASPTPTPDDFLGGIDSCLVGVWTMDTYALNMKFLDLTHSPIMFIVSPSAMSMTLNVDGSYGISGETIVRADIPGGSDFMQLTATHSGEGQFSADGTSILLSDSTYAVAFGTLTINIDGETTEGPFSAIPLPEDFMSPPPTMSYACSANALLITYDAPSGTITEEWTR